MAEVNQQDPQPVENPQNDLTDGMGEWVKFAVLTAILLLVPVIILGLRAPIFENYLPRIMGWDQPPALVEPEPQSEEPAPAVDPVAEPTAEPDEANEEAPPAETEEVEADTVDTADTKEEVETVEETSEAEAETAVDDPTPEPEAAPTTEYLVQPGDNLTRIADTFGLTLAELLAANPELSDPNRLQAGITLLIPTSGE